MQMSLLAFNSPLQQPYMGPTGGAPHPAKEFFPTNPKHHHSHASIPILATSFGVLLVVLVAFCVWVKCYLNGPPSPANGIAPPPPLPAVQEEIEMTLSDTELEV